jgi:hypothetical protein
MKASKMAARLAAHLVARKVGWMAVETGNLRAVRSET